MTSSICIGMMIRYIKYIIVWVVGMCGLFMFSKLATWFMEFCESHDKQWWGGATLWITGGIGGFIPMFVFMAYILHRLYRIIHD